MKGLVLKSKDGRISDANACVYPDGIDGEPVPLEAPIGDSLHLLERVCDEIGRVEARLDELKDMRSRLPSIIRDELNGEQRVNAARYLYWSMPDMRAEEIAAGLLGLKPGQFLRIAGPIVSDLLRCDKCGCRLLVNSRTHFEQLLQQRRELTAANANMFCSTCVKPLVIARQEQWDEAEERRRARLIELRMMPYLEYLRSPEWAERRQVHLRSAGFKCQVCNGKGVLDVHHRTYERRGCEYFKDLIVLCRDCHDLFHKHGRLCTQKDGEAR